MVAGSEFVLRFSSAKEDTVAEALVVTLLLALFSGGVDRSLFLEFACHASSTGGVLLGIVATCFEAVEQLLSTGDFTLGLL
jgi:hypothetical protein